MTPPIIRPAKLQDGPRLAELCTQLGYPSTPEQLILRLSQVLDRGDHAVLIAEVEGIVSGWAHVRIIPSLEIDQAAEVGGLIVDETVRGQGVGKALMGQAEDWARRHDCKQVWLRSNILRKEAHRFYQALGYEIIKTSYTFHKQI